MSAETYWQNRMMAYGPCHLCGGPQTQSWDVAAPDGPESLMVSMGLLCLSCGYGDPSYRPKVEGMPR